MTQENSDSPNVAEVGDRIEVLDLMRGIAVLGILLMNVQSFSMIESAYFNPTAYGDFEGINAVVWAVERLFADQKFMTLFSLLFGAGIILIRERAIARGRSPALIHYRRMVFLLGIGLLHAYFLWYGDILTFYALCGAIVYPLSRLRASFQFAIGFVAIVIPSLIFAAIQHFIPEFGPEFMREFKQAWIPDEELVQWELDLYRGGYLQQMEHRIRTAFESHTIFLFLWFGWRVIGLMLWGMALLKWNILTGRRSRSFYKRLMVFGLVVGFLLESFGIVYQSKGDWDVMVMIPGMQFNYWASVATAAGYLGMIVLWQHSRWGGALRNALVQVGRMAFTNYIAQTLVCTTLFYGHGFGLFGYVSRWQQLLIVLAIWVVQIGWSVFWLRHFRYGPLEWLWRCATYLQIVPLRKDGSNYLAPPPILRS